MKKTIFACSGLLALILMAGCASKAPDKEAWLKDLPVDAQTSLKGSRHQDLRLQQIYETREASGKLWMRGKGFADVNDHTQKYFWESKSAPNLEITIMTPDSSEFKQCQILFDQMPTKRRGVQLQGDGLFSAKGNEDEGFVGIFRIDKVTQCTLSATAVP